MKINLKIWENLIKPYVVYNFSNSNLKYEQKLGSGSFAKVYKVRKHKAE